MDREQAVEFVRKLLAVMVKRGASDLFITAGFPPAVKLDGEITCITDKPLTKQSTAIIIRGLMNDRQSNAFDATQEANFAIAPPGIGRFRVSAFMQQGCVGGVLRTIETRIPDIHSLGLPPQLKDIALEKRGLVLLVGATGSGKSTTLAALTGYRNENSQGHIVTIEDPIEYVHEHKNCVVTQREIGVDTQNWDNALKNTLRQAPDVILIGEIRTRETMEYALNFAETGHLVMSTLHGNSANQALDRIINFFPEEKRDQVLMDLSLNTRAIISQRLVRKEGDGRTVALEILANSPYVADLLFKGEVAALKEAMAQSPQFGMMTFDQSLFDLFEAGVISYEEALRNADSRNELRLRIKLQSKRDPQLPGDDEAAANLHMKTEDEFSGMPDRGRSR